MDWYALLANIRTKGRAREYGQILRLTVERPPIRYSGGVQSAVVGGGGPGLRATRNERATCFGACGFSILLPPPVDGHYRLGAVAYLVYA